jgi:hypothetical protein
MDPLKFDQDAPKSFILAADPQFTNISPENDQVWELDLKQTSIYPFHLHTTYGLRASSMRLFPNLVRNNQQLLVNGKMDPKPYVSQYAPAFLKINSILENNIAFSFDVFAIESDVLVGEVTIENGSDEAIDLTLRLAAVLTPMGMGMSSRPEKEVNQHFITGNSDEFWPVLFISGGPTGVSNPYPALSLPLQISDHETARVSWALASKKSQYASLTKAQTVLGSNWREKAMRQIMSNAAKTIQIRTGNPDWDAAFSLAQTCARSHLGPTTIDEEKPHILRSRLPDNTPSRGKDSQKQDDLTTLESNHLAQVLLPSHPKIFENQIRTYLRRTEEDGSLNSRLQNSPFLKPYKEPPLLAKLSLDHYETHQHKDFLLRIFPQLCRIFESWIMAPASTQGEIIPSWQNPQQLQLETGLFSFDIWEDWGRGIDIQMVKSPSLAAMLLRETKSLMKMSEILGDDIQYQRFLGLSQKLEKSLQEFWVESRAEFCYQDRQSSRSPSREFHYPSTFQEKIEFNKTFVEPQRLLCHLYSGDEKTRACRVRIQGADEHGKAITEEFAGREILWVLGRAHLMTKNLFHTLESLSIEGLSREDRFVIESVDLQQTDITCLLPVWSDGIRQEQLEALIETALDQNDPALINGIPETWRSHTDLPANLPINVNVMWNTLIIEGLVSQGLNLEARDLFSNLMETIVHGLKNYNGFFPGYDHENRLPSGGRNAIAGLAPLHLFLKIAGIKLLSPSRVAVWGSNPFPWPIEVHWQGLSLIRHGAHTRITFSNGAVYESSSEDPQLITPSDVHEGKP